MSKLKLLDAYTKESKVITSRGADYAEVGEWSDGNTNNEDRIGYFVSVDDTSPGITMIKSTSTSDVRGAIMANPGFVANATADKFGEDGNLLPKYDYVGFVGFIPVIDNGTCTVNKYCVSANDGTAIPSTNDYGYQVIERIDATHILILMEPQGDDLQRLSKDVENLQLGGLADYAKKVDLTALTNTVKSNWNGGGKNLFQYNINRVTFPYVSNGITFTRDDDGVLTANGTSTSDYAYVDLMYIENMSGTYILSGCDHPNIADIHVYCITDNDFPLTVQQGEGQITFDESKRYYITPNVFPNKTVTNLKFYPMLRLASDTDDTYVPYAKDNLNLTKIVRDAKDRKYIGKNILPNNGKSTLTTNGITFTKNSDGSVKVVGTASGQAYYEMITPLSKISDYGIKVGETYHISGCNTITSDMQLFLNFHTDTNDYLGGLYSSSDSIRTSFTVPRDTTRMYYDILVEEGKTVNTTVYPMVCIAADADDIYKPYLPNNTELSSRIDSLSTNIGQVSTNLSNNKLDKVTSTGDRTRLYAVTSSGAQGMMGIASDNTVSTVVYRNSSGNFAVSDPTSAQHPVTKSYFESNKDIWTSVVQKVTGDTSVVFNNLNSTYGYDLFAETADGSIVTTKSCSKSAGTNSGTIKLTYTVKAIESAQSPVNFKLRIFR